MLQALTSVSRRCATTITARTDDQLPEPLIAEPDGIFFVDTLGQSMKTRIQKWGNSLALRIPRPFAEECNLHEDSAVDVTVRNGKLVVAPIPEPQFTLEQLVKQITPRNRHREVHTGERVGNEVW